MLVAHTSLPSFKIPYFNQNYFLKGSVKSLSENVKNFQSNKKINFSTESVKKSTNYDLLFITTIYYLQNVNKHPSEMKNQLQNSLFTISTVFPGFGPFLTEAPKLWLAATFFKKYLYFLVLDRPIKTKKSVKRKVIASFFRR